MKKKSTLSAAFGVAAVWFGGHAGGGFATGRQEVSFFVKYGYSAAWIPVFSMILLGIAFYYGIEFARVNKTFDYKSFSKKLYAPYDTLFANIFEVVYLYVIVLATGAAIAGASSLMQQSLGMSYGLSVIITGSVLLVFTIFGAGLVRKASSYMTIFLVGSLVLITVLGISDGSENIAKVLAEKPATAGIGAALFSALLYASFQSMLIGPLVSVADKLETRKDSFNSALIGIVLNGMILILVCFMLIGRYPEITAETLPVFFITSALGHGWLATVYSLILFFALISTGVGFVFGGVKRFENAFSAGTLQMRRFGLSVVFLVISGWVSLFGLIAIIAKGYSSLGYVCILLNLIPLLVIAPLKLKKMKAEETGALDEISG